LRRKKTLDVLRRELEGLGGRAHHETLCPSRGANHGRINGRDGTDVRVGWNTHEGRLDTVWEAIVLPSGPRAIDRGGDVTSGTGGGDLRRALPTATDKDENNHKGQYNNDSLHIVLYKHNFS
jgi:hypothetical protein